MPRPTAQRGRFALPKMSDHDMPDLFGGTLSRPAAVNYGLAMSLPTVQSAESKIRSRITIGREDLGQPE